MRTNKNCPKYGEDSDIQIESKDPEKASTKSTSMDITAQPQRKPTVKKIIPKGLTKIAVVEAPKGDKSTTTTSKAKVLKVKCGSTANKVTPDTSQLSDKPVTSDADTPNKSSSVKVNRIVFSNKVVKPDDVQVVESQKPPSSIVIRPPPLRPVVVETDRDQPRKKIIIKRPKEVDLDQTSQEGSTGLEYHKTKKIVELLSFQKHGRQYEEAAAAAAKRKNREDKRWWEEREKRRISEKEKKKRWREGFSKNKRGSLRNKRG